MKAKIILKTIWAAIRPGWLLGRKNQLESILNSSTNRGLESFKEILKASREHEQRAQARREQAAREAEPVPEAVERLNKLNREVEQAQERFAQHVFKLAVALSKPFDESGRQNLTDMPEYLDLMEAKEDLLILEFTEDEIWNIFYQLGINELAGAPFKQISFGSRGRVVGLAYYNTNDSHVHVAFQALWVFFGEASGVKPSSRSINKAAIERTVQRLKEGKADVVVMSKEENKNFTKAKENYEAADIFKNEPIYEKHGIKIDVFAKPYILVKKSDQELLDEARTFAAEKEDEARSAGKERKHIVIEGRPGFIRYEEPGCAFEYQLDREKKVYLKADDKKLIEAEREISQSGKGKEKIDEPNINAETSNFAFRNNG